MGDVLLPGGLGHNGTGCTPPSLWYEIPAVISLGLKFRSMNTSIRNHLEYIP